MVRSIIGFFLADAGLDAPGNLKVDIDVEISSLHDLHLLGRDVGMDKSVSNGVEGEAMGVRSGADGVEQIYDLLKFCGQGSRVSADQPELLPPMCWTPLSFAYVGWISGHAPV